MPQIQVLVEPELSVVAFYCRDVNGSRAEDDIATEELVRFVNRAGRVYLATTRIHERTVARIAILNVRTTAAIIEDTLSMISTYVEEKAAADAVLT
jgi:glutamate/tyrosine decarboxylase-like PLP-dependent enzyme